MADAVRGGGVEAGPEPAVRQTAVGGDDLPSAISYAASRDVRVLLYVSRIALSDADSLFALYRSWGVAGVKLGFINDGTQAMTSQITGWVKTAAKYNLVIDTHDDVPPFGYERTYPNWLSMEGVQGNEHLPPARHNVTLPFARNIGGLMDYTICYGRSRDRTTNAHQMAMAAVYYQPLNFLYWYDSPSKYATASDCHCGCSATATPATPDHRAHAARPAGPLHPGSCPHPDATATRGADRGHHQARPAPTTPIQVQYERKADHFLAFTSIACTLVCYRRLSK